jgi:hypothetical protein
MGSITLANSRVKGKVINRAKVKESANLAIGKNSTANMASITLKGSEVGKGGTVLNQADIQKGWNTAKGEKATANMGSITLE